MISVAMATYNGSKYIKEQLNSILNQTLPVDEVIICDDKSQDDTVKIIKEFIEQHSLVNWKVIINEKNLGYIANFIKAISLTKGDIIFLSDQDDIWLNNKVQDMSKIIHTSSMTMLHSAIDVIDEKGKILFKNHHQLPKGLHKLSFHQYCKHLNYCGMSSAFTSELRNYLKFIDVSKAPTHDWVLGLLAVNCRGFYTTGNTYSLRRWHGNNAAMTFKKAKRDSIQERIDVITQYKDFYQYGLNLLNLLSSNGKNELEKYYNNAIQRIKCLQNDNKWGSLVTIRNIRFFPSVKAYICDLLYAFDVFKKISRIRNI